jgi:hypothetical protein
MEAKKVSTSVEGVDAVVDVVHVIVKETIPVLYSTQMLAFKLSLSRNRLGHMPCLPGDKMPFGSTASLMV